jgi:hypothetical protein
MRFSKLVERAAGFYLIVMILIPVIAKGVNWLRNIPSSDWPEGMFGIFFAVVFGFSLVIHYLEDILEIILNRTAKIPDDD